MVIDKSITTYIPKTISACWCMSV